MNIKIRWLTGETEIISILADKHKIAYEEMNEIAKIYVDDELVEIINLKAIASIEFKEGADGVVE